MNISSNQFPGSLTVRDFDMKLTANQSTNSSYIHDSPVYYQLSQSTDDIERNLFFEGDKTALLPMPPPNKGTILVVLGDMFTLEEEATHPQPVPLTEQSGLFRIINLANR